MIFRHAVDRGLGKIDADTVGHGDRRFFLAIPRQYAEFLATDPARNVAVAHRALDDLAELRDRPIADLMAPHIVDRLEVVDIGHHQRDRHAFLLGPLHRRNDVLLEGPAGTQARQPVEIRLFAHLLDLVVDAGTDQHHRRHQRNEGECQIEHRIIDRFAVDIGGDPLFDQQGENRADHELRRH